MDKSCIVCREHKDTFNAEHVFPAAIGGAFTIGSVCQQCNSNIGATIDTPFVNHKHILYLRSIYDIKRGNRNIKNPFSGKQITANGEEVIVLKSDKGFYYEKIPKLEIFETAHGPVGRVSIPQRAFMADKDGLTERYKRQLEEMVQQPIVHTRLEENFDNTPVSISLIDSNNPLIFGFLKIAYETAVSCIPAYFDDELAVMYSQMLKQCEIDYSLVSFITPGHSLGNRINERLLDNAIMENFPSGIAIMNIEGYGLVCRVKVLYLEHSLVLSSKMSYIDDRIIFLLNDSKEQKMFYSVAKRIASFEIQLDSLHFTDQHYQELQAGVVLEDIFRDGPKTIPLYDMNGTLLLPHLEYLLHLQPFHCDYASLATVQSYSVQLPDGLYLQSVRSGLQYKLIEVKFQL